MTKQEYAVELKHSNHNCCQAVICAYAEEIGIDYDTLKKLGAGFGSGMATMEGTCGALCGAQMLLGIDRYNGKPIHKDSGRLYNLFKEKCGSTICGELKGIKTGKILCDCDSCVRFAVDSYEELKKESAE
jgi:C_GCAxxG_C_C family probable redox protein